jgi:hypothetical protein
MKNFGSNGFKLSLVFVICVFVVGLFIINSNFRTQGDIYGEATVKNATISNNQLPNYERVKCNYGWCYDRTIICGDGTSCLAKASCHLTEGCAVIDCCGGHSSQ